MVNNISADKPQEQLSQLFGSYKAEWLRDEIYSLYTEPTYLPELKTSRPCLLVGGRGTGKTTVLRSLSYEGQFALNNNDPHQIDSWAFYGIYYRVNTNRVTAFSGDELPVSKWADLFAHYFNLLLCDLTLRFLSWYQRHRPNAQQLDAEACKRVARSLNIAGEVESVRVLANKIDDLKIEFEAHINNVANTTFRSLSIQGAPIDILAEALSQLPQFRNKDFFFLLDEYENFEDYQQQVVNTLIKHAGQYYSFKIGVRELGWRRKTTLNENEQLIHPADYVRINIAEKLSDDKFKKFALDVCNARLSKVHLLGQKANYDISHILPGLTEDEEALELGVKEVTKSVKEKIALLQEKELCRIAENLSPLELYFVDYWAESKGLSVRDVLNEISKDQSGWNTRYNNYKHALLFTIRRRKRGIQKYYAGWDVFVSLSANNIRYLLELVDQSLVAHLNEGGKLGDLVSPKTQTIAAQNAGRKNLSELEGLSVHGARLTKLLLSLGRIFQVMASDMGGHTPELNQFHLSEDTSLTEDIDRDVKELLTSAVMHLALIRFPGNKLTDEADIRDYDYMMHPIFTPFFVFSYRKKRKMVIAAGQLLGLVNSPKVTIRQLLEQHNRNPEDSLPDQLTLFEGYYLEHT
ncbi:MAG: hypothetical protein AABZ15_05600 [Nitrospirota bacterium]